MISVFLLALLASMFFWPYLTPWLGITLLVVGLGIPISHAVNKHKQRFNQAECTREKMIRNLAFDTFGFLLTMGAAMYVGRLAGGYFGLRSGFWIGLLAGFAGGFVTAWAVRSAWGRLVAVA